MKSITSLSLVCAIFWSGIFTAVSRAQSESSSNPFGDRVPANRMEPDPPPEPDPEPAPAPSPEIESAPEIVATDSEIQALEKMRAAWLETARKPLDLLTSRYKTALEKYRADSQAAGKLKPVLAAKTALDALATGQTAAASEDPVVANLQKVYLANLPAAQASARQGEARADQDYLIFLRKLVVKFTREGKLDLAQKAQTEADQVTARVGKGDALSSLSGPAGVVILSAIYGHGEKSADVTPAVKKFVETKKSFRVTPPDLGADPNPYWHKGLTIKYTKGGVEREQRRGENEIVLPESFFGPQDGRELEQWLAGTLWKSDVRLEFRRDKKFSVTGSLGSHAWEVQDSPRKVFLVWAPEKKVECNFDAEWNSFEEASEGKRVFKRSK